MKKTLFIFIFTFLTGVSAMCQIPSNGLLGWWAFNGNTIDLSGYGNNGDVVGGAYLTTDRFGVVNSAYYCITASYIDVPNYAWTYPEISVSGWFKSTTGARIFQHEFCSPNGVWLIITPGINTLQAIFGKCNSTQINLFSNVNTLDNQWHHVVITKSSSGAKMYVDATLTASYNNTFVLNTSTGHLYFGSPEATYNTYNGSVDDVRIYNRELTQSEVTALFNESSAYSVTTESDPAIGGSTAGMGMYKTGTQVTVTASAFSGYTFSHWTENGVVLSSASSYSFIVSGNKNLVAHFTPLQNSQPFGQLVKKFRLITNISGNICCNNNYLFNGNYRNGGTDTIYTYTIPSGNLVGSQHVIAGGSSGGYGIKATFNRMYVGSDQYTLKSYDITNILNWTPVQTIGGLDRGFLRSMMSYDSTIIAWGGHWAGTYQFFDISSGSLVTKCKVNTNGNNYNADHYQNSVYIENGTSANVKADISNFSSCTVSPFGGSCGGCPHVTNTGFIVYGPRSSSCNPQRIEIYNQSNVLTGSLQGSDYSPALCLPDNYVLVNNYTINKQVLYNIYDGTFNHPVDTVFNNTTGGYLFNDYYIFRFINDSCEVYSRFAPALQATGVTFSNSGSTQVTVNWTDGNGSKRVVFMKQDSVGKADPDYNTTYTAQAVFGSGSQIGSSGWFCVFNGTAHAAGVTVTGLQPSIKYRVMVCEYNGSPGHEQYNTTVAENNPLNFIDQTISCPESFTDTRDGKIYHGVQIGSQCWMKENLNIGIKINGAQIQENNSQIEKYCYNEMESNCDIYGGLYNWNEAMNYETSSNANPSNRTGICPSDWHMPSDLEWAQLSNYLGGDTVAGGKMKEPGTTHWWSPNFGATNSSGFTGIAAGIRLFYSPWFYDMGRSLVFWSSTESNTFDGIFYSLDFSVKDLFHSTHIKTEFGFSLRCVKNGCSSYTSTGISITPLSNPVCFGNSVTLIANPTNGGSSPSYQWKLNGTNINGATNATYTYVPTNGDVITCTMTSSASCVTGSPATSNAVTMSVTPSNPVSVMIFATSTLLCQGSSVTFFANPANGGTSPVYQWKVNGVNAGTNNQFFTYVPANNDQVNCTVTSNISCPANNPATSNTMSVTVNPVVPVSVAIAAASNPVCAGSAVNFTASPVNPGSNPTYAWKVNGNTMVTGPAATTFGYVPANGDQVQCTLTSGDLCTTGSPALSNLITVQTNPLPVPTLSGPVNVCLNSVGNTYTTEAAMNSYVWTVNGGVITSGGNYSSNTATVTWTTAGSKSISVSYTSGAGCTASLPSMLPVTVSASTAPGVPGAISGPTNVAPGQTNVVYTVPAITGATGYIWQLPQGATITAGSSTNTITVAFSSSATSGNITVYGTSNCGNGPVSGGYYVNVGNTIPIVLSLYNLSLGNGITLCYNATQNILVAGNGSQFNALSGSNLTLIAGQKILFLPGTTMHNGSYVHGYITQTGNYCANPNVPLVAVVTGQEESHAAGVEEKLIRVYPNPTSAIFTLELTRNPSEVPVRVECYSVTGIRVIDVDIHEGLKHSLTLAGQAPGIYLLRVVQDGRVENWRVVKL